MTGEKTAKITGDLTLNGVTKSVVLDAVLNQVGDHPVANKPWAGFDATTTLVPVRVSTLACSPPSSATKSKLHISIEAMKAE